MQNTQPSEVKGDYQNGLLKFPQPQQNPSAYDAAIGREMVGANQLAELNKLKLGLIA